MILTEINVYGGEHSDYSVSNYDLQTQELVIVTLENVAYKYSAVQPADHVAFKANPTTASAASIFQNHTVTLVENNADTSSQSEA